MNISNTFTAQRRALCAALLLALTAACSIGPAARETPVAYDLGPQRAIATGGARMKAALVLDFSAPSWLDNTGIIYRLGYLDAARPQRYANSRWIAPPPALMTQRARSRFAAAADVVTGGDGVRAAYALHVTLDDFSQSFASPDRSGVVVKARATLINLGTRALVAQRTFADDRPAQADAQGAARALAQAGDAVIESLLEWTAQNLSNDARSASQ
jgi:cholesterol transport system auxiliary component